MNIIFTAAARNTIRRSERGVVGMIVKDAKVPATNPAMIYKEKDIPEELSDANKEQVKLALVGNDTAPAKIVLYVLGSNVENYEAALNYFAVKKVTWLCCPTAKTDSQTETIVKWVKDQRDERNKVKAVLPETEADNEGIINYATASAKVGEKEYTAESFCSRIAGLLAGTSNKSSATYAILNDVTECEKKKKTELDAEIDAGKLVLYYDGEKVKVGRGVNSLQTVSKGKGNPWKKIRVVESMDMIHDDNYIGKYPNTYANKCLLISAINSYLAEMERNGIIEGYTIDLDVDAIKEYIIKNKGETRDEAEAMSEAEIKKQYTDEKVFLAASATLVDVMEDIDLNITV